MKKVQLFLASLPLALSVACGTTNELVFEDDFEGTGLPDSLRWNYEEGYVRNGELQYYTVARPENCYRQDGYLHIVVRTVRQTVGDAGRYDPQHGGCPDYLGQHYHQGSCRMEILPGRGARQIARWNRHLARYLDDARRRYLWRMAQERRDGYYGECRI